MTTGEFRTLASSYQDVQGHSRPDDRQDHGVAREADEAADGGDAAPRPTTPRSAARRSTRRRSSPPNRSRSTRRPAPKPAPKAARDAEVRVESLDELVEFFTAAGKKGVAINRYKGLGEMNPDTLWETTMNPATRTLAQVTRRRPHGSRPDVHDADGRPGRAAPQVHRRQRARRQEPRYLTQALSREPESRTARPDRRRPDAIPSTESHRIHYDRHLPEPIPRQHRRRDEALVHGLRDERNHRARAARRPRRAEAGAPPRALRDAADGPRVEPRLPQVREDRRRGHRQLPPARRRAGLRHARPPRAGLQHALPPGRRPGELRLGRRRSAGGVSATPRRASRRSPKR